MKNIKFSVFCNRITGEIIPAKSIDDLLDKAPKRIKEHWSSISFKDDKYRTIRITRDFLDQGMTLGEVIEDWLTFATPEDLQADIKML